ncbi:unnamed protein product [Meloidogyne enterolobii]|uniref:Uncharacterized protein n=1 Tax=Meloidogyne enterolobii TaxID=390850 RepID=A0ACB1A7E8_MELEN
MMRIISVYAANKRNLVPKQLLVQSDLLKQQRLGIFIQLCNKCKEDQQNREEYLFKFGNGENFVLSIRLCGDDLDKNILLADYYAKIKGKLYIKTKTYYLEGSKKLRSKEFKEGSSKSTLEIGK